MKKIISLMLAMLMVVSLCACGSSHGSYTTSESYVEAPAAAPYYDYKAEEYYEAYDNAVSGESGGLAASGAQIPAEGENPQATVNPDKIIYSADATVETTNFDETIEKLNKLISDFGGWVESSSMNGSNYYNKSHGNSSTRSADYTIRIPSQNFSTLMTSLSDLGNIPYTHTYTQNVTAQYYDTQARLTAYKAQETRLLEMMELAKTVEDIITIEEKLTDVRYMIESLQSSLNNWDRKVNYSTVELSVREVREYTPQAPVKVSYGQRLLNTFIDSVKGAGEFFADLLVVIVALIPTIVILAVLFFVFRPVFKKLLPKWKAKRAEKKAAKAAKKEAKAAKKEAKAAGKNKE